MKESALLILVFIFGAFSGHLFSYSFDGFTEILLYILLFLVGIEIGRQKITKEFISIDILILPASVIFGSLLGGLVVTLLFSHIDSNTGMAIASGFGYYSLSSIILTESHGPYIGAIALASNVLRETLVICLAPFIIRYISPRAYIASAGATSMDTSLPQLIRYSSNMYVATSVASGFVLTILVPIFVTYFAG